MSESINQGLISFLNKHIPNKIIGLHRISSLKYLGNCNQFSFSEGKVNEQHVWNVEIYSELLDECDSFKILEIIPKYISFYGEPCDIVQIKSLSPSKIK